MSKFKGVFAQFLSKFCWLIYLFFLRLYDSKYAENDSWLDTVNISLVIMQVFLLFWKGIFVFFTNSLKKDCKSQTYCWIHMTSGCCQQILSHLGSESKENLSKFGQKMTKTPLNFDTFYWMLVRHLVVWCNITFTVILNIPIRILLM